MYINLSTVENAEAPTENVHEEDRQKNLAFLLEKVEGCSVSIMVNTVYGLTHMLKVKGIW